MFEKEAEEYVPNIKWHDFSSKDLREEMMLCYRKGAEYGYNKALEEATHNYNAIIADYDKRIAELGKHNTELLALINAERERQEKCDDIHLRTIAELEKENAELKMQLEEWKKCFLACSSPFCSKHFPTVESSGVLGNMEKKENV